MDVSGRGCHGGGELSGVGSGIDADVAWLQEFRDGVDEMGFVGFRHSILTFYNGQSFPCG